MELFDDKTLDDYTPREWIQRGQGYGIAARGLNKNNQYEWKDVVITGYDEKNDKFEGEWIEDRTPAKLSRIHVAFYVRKDFLK